MTLSIIIITQWLIEIKKLLPIGFYPARHQGNESPLASTEGTNCHFFHFLLPIIALHKLSMSIVSRRGGYWTAVYGPLPRLNTYFVSPSVCAQVITNTGWFVVVNRRYYSTGHSRVLKITISDALNVVYLYQRYYDSSNLFLISSATSFAHRLNSESVLNE